MHRPSRRKPAELHDVSRVVDHVAVESMDRIAKEWIEARALLSHVVEQRIRAAGVDVTANANGRRLDHQLR